MDGAQLQFCADYSASLTQSYNGIVESAFLYPALWSTWEVQTVHTHIRDTDYYCVDEAELALQIVFQHVASSEPSPGNPNYFAQNCGVDFTLGAENSSPTPGMQWCDEPDCNLCLASQLFDRTQLANEDFCRCNVWNGAAETCHIANTTTTSPSFTVTVASASALLMILTIAVRRIHLRRRMLYTIVPEVSAEEMFYP
jgi:hypothetical protein